MDPVQTIHDRVKGTAAWQKHFDEHDNLIWNLIICDDTSRRAFQDYMNGDDPLKHNDPIFTMMCLLDDIYTLEEKV